MTSSQVLELVQRFDRNQDAYKSASYKEARVRAEFIDPFFEALGWCGDTVTDAKTTALT